MISAHPEAASGEAVGILHRGACRAIWPGGITPQLDREANHKYFASFRRLAKLGAPACFSNKPKQAALYDFVHEFTVV